MIKFFWSFLANRYDANHFSVLQPRSTHFLMDGSSVGGLHKNLVASSSDLLHVSWGKGCPPLPYIDVLSADGNHTLMVMETFLATKAAPQAPALRSNES